MERRVREIKVSRCVVEVLVVLMRYLTSEQPVSFSASSTFVDAANVGVDKTAAPPAPLTAMEIGGAFRADDDVSGLPA